MFSSEILFYEFRFAIVALVHLLNEQVIVLHAKELAAFGTYIAFVHRLGEFLFVISACVVFAS